MSDSLSDPTSAGPASSGPKPPLGVGRIVGDSFSILFRHFFAVMVLGFVPVLLGQIVSGSLVGWGVSFRAEENPVAGGPAAVALNAALQMVINGLLVALLVQMAYDAKLGRRLRLGAYVAPALRAAVPIAVLSIVVGILAAIGLALFVIPGLWIYAVFSVTAAAVVIDRAGFGAMGRSAGLTREYRWPILGTLIVVMISSFVLNFVAVFVVGMLLGAIPGGLILGILLLAALSALAYGLSSISVALIYARLREIKEGASLADIVAVFA